MTLLLCGAVLDAFGRSHEHCGHDADHCRRVTTAEGG